MTEAPARLTVLTSMSAERASTNPYVVELNRRLAERTDLLRFSWRALLGADWDVFHVHWPEVLVRRSSVLRTLAACLAMAIGMVRARATGRRVVRTMHNVAPHERQPMTVRAVLRLVDASTSGWIRLNDRTAVPDHGVVATIPHGTYRDWFADQPHPPRLRRRIMYAGLVRPYKGVDVLLAAFAGMVDDEATLHVCGRVADASYGSVIRALATGDPRVTVDLRHVPDDVLAREIGEATLVVLPYRELHNSGTALLALSLDRPVLVPSNEATADLAREVGDDWVLRFDGELTSAALAAAIERAADLRGSPDLSARSWDAIADEHVTLFERVAPRGSRSADRAEPGRVVLPRP